MTLITSSTPPFFSMDIISELRVASIFGDLNIINPITLPSPPPSIKLFSFVAANPLEGVMTPNLVVPPCAVDNTKYFAPAVSNVVPTLPVLAADLSNATVVVTACIFATSGNISNIFPALTISGTASGPASIDLIGTSAVVAPAVLTSDISYALLFKNITWTWTFKATPNTFTLGGINFNVSIV